MRIELHVGETHSLLLQKEGVGGYNWFVIASNKEGLAITTKTLTAPAKILGAGAMLQVQISAVQTGHYVVTAEWRRSWEKRAAKVQQYEVVVS